MLLKRQITPLSPAGCNVDYIPLLDHCVDILQTTYSYYLGEYSDIIWVFSRNSIFHENVLFFDIQICLDNIWTFKHSLSWSI